MWEGGVLQKNPFVALLRLPAAALLAEPPAPSRPHPEAIFPPAAAPAPPSSPVPSFARLRPSPAPLPRSSSSLPHFSFPFGLPFRLSLGSRVARAPGWATPALPLASPRLPPRRCPPARPPVLHGPRRTEGRRMVCPPLSMAGLEIAPLPRASPPPRCSSFP